MKQVNVLENHEGQKIIYLKLYERQDLKYKVLQFKNQTRAKIWLIHRILQLNSYPLQCTPLPYLHTAAFVSSIVQSRAISHHPPGRSVAVPFLPSPLQLMENGFPSVHFLLWCTEKSHRVLNPWIWRMFKYSNAFIRKKLLEQKGVVSWGIVLMQHPYVVLPEIRPLLPQDLSHCLSVNTHHVCNHSLTQMSIFSNNFTDFLNVLVSFQSRSVTWMLIIFHFLPTLTKSFVPLKHTWTWH